MKEQKNLIKLSFFKKIFIKICRTLGYEIIDQSSFYVPTQKKFLDENLSIQGKKSINLPLGETKITRKVNSLTVILRSCTKVNMLTQKLLKATSSNINKIYYAPDMRWHVCMYM